MIEGFRHLHHIYGEFDVHISFDPAVACRIGELLRLGNQRRLDEREATPRMVATALARHKPSTQLQYDVGRRLVVRWLRAEGLTTLTFRDFRLLAWDMQDAGYCVAYVRLVHNATAEVP